MDRPEWWNWDVRFVSHFQRRMEERVISEIDLRTMLTDATAITSSRRSGRWLISTHLGDAPWVVVVEPDPDDEITYVVTAYPISVTQ